MCGFSPPYSLGHVVLCMVVKVILCNIGCKFLYCMLDIVRCTQLVFEGGKLQ